MRRVRAWELREEVREHALAPLRQKACGVWRYSKHVELRAPADGGTAWWHGVIQCRARMCPVCWIARRYKVGAEVAWTVGARERDTEMQSYLITLTIRHSASDPVSICKDVRGCWRTLVQSRAFQRWKKEHGVEFICAEEVTRGDNGWHPHLHVLAMPGTKPIDPRDTWGLSGLFFMHWRRVVERKMGSEHAPIRQLGDGKAIGADFRPCDAAGYLTKLGYELADPAAQKGNAPLALLEDGQIDSYMELQRSRHRARDITYSRGLKPYRDRMPEGDGFVTLLGLRGSDWGRLRHLGWEQPLEVADAATDARAAREAITARLGEVEEPIDDDDHSRWE